MKYEELIDFTQKILEANYLPVYRFELPCEDLDHRSEEHPSELQSHSFISYAVFCLKKIFL